MTKQNESELNVPSTYDYFYFDYSILNEFKSIEDVNNFSSSKLNCSLFENIRGFSYFIELVLIDIVDHVEGLVKNSTVFDILHWSDSSIKEDAVRKLIESEKIVSYIFELNKIRKQFSRIRTLQKKITDKDIKDWKYNYQVFLEKLLEIDTYLRKDLGIKQIKNDARSQISNWFQVKYNYIEGDCEDVFNWDETKIISSYPGGTPFFYTMPEETRKIYHLENPMLKKYFEEYLQGYKIALIYFYNIYLDEDQYKIAKLEINKAKQWYEIHKAYGVIIKLTEKEKSLFDPIFKITNKDVVKEVVPNSIITEKYELDLIFRRINNLRIKTIRHNSNISEWGSQSLFYHILFGAKDIQQENIEILEFKQEYEDQAMIEYSYAIFMPISSSISDGSYWIFFDRVALSSTKDNYKSTSKYMTDAYLKVLCEKRDYNLKTYNLKGSLLKEYIRNRDLEEKQISLLNEKVKTSKGLLGQFMAYLFLAKEYGAKLIDISKMIGSTDIDIIAENENNCYLVQAKTTFPITNKSIDYLKNHFNQIEGHVTTGKTIKRILFLIDEESEEDTEYMLESELDGLSSEDMGERIGIVKKLLKEESIEIKSYKDLKNKLSGKEYVDFLAKTDSVFDYFECKDSYGDFL